MHGPFNSALLRLVRACETRLSPNDPVRLFHSNHYLRHNARRLEHLASLRIPVRGASVLEVGAGAGDHSHYYLDRGCTVTITEARPENLEYLRGRYPQSDVRFLDMERPQPLEGAPFDIVHCYGLLYHVADPGAALAYMASNTRRMLLLETCVSFGDELKTNNVPERQHDVTQSYSGVGSRPTRTFIWDALRELFPHVYVPATQPNHEEFPIDWTDPGAHKAPLQRAVFVASLAPLENDLLLTELPVRQRRHE